MSLGDELENAWREPAKRREITKWNAELWAAGMSGRRFVGDKLGGKYLRAPDIYHTILNQYGDNLVRLGNVAAVRCGVTTGANDFFHLTPEIIDEFGIEGECCRPVMTAAQESRGIAVDPARLSKRLFMCHDDKGDLAGTGALAYIQCGEKQEYHQRTSAKSRQRWYDLGERGNVHLGMNKFVDTTARTYLAEEGSPFSDNFQIMPLAGNGSPMRLCAAVNSTLFQLMLNTASRSNFGEGVLEIQTYETANLQIVNPLLLAEPAASVCNAADWDVLTPSAARRHNDGPVFDALGLTAGERVGVYEGVTEMVSNRRRRAGSVQGTSSAASQDQMAGKPAFSVVPIRGGYAPGVNDHNLKDIIFDLEDQEFLEKLNQ